MNRLTMQHNRRKVLKALKKLNCALPNAIAKEAGVHRVTVMKHLNRLVNEGLVHRIRARTGRGGNPELFIFFMDGAIEEG